jgi:EAL domain-containing protein (putative c-di-GMP-specific phosphodiesterase class I)/CheY-like chemotaxis protein
VRLACSVPSIYASFRSAAFNKCYCFNMAESAPMPSWKVLVVDDDAQTLRGLKRALQATRLEVTTVRTGVAALAELRKQRFDALLSDIWMSAMSGLKLARAVREQDLDLPVVLMTAQPDLKSAAGALEYGVTHYLFKPFDPDKLRAVVERAVNAGRIARLKRQCAPAFASGAFYVADSVGLESRFERALASVFMVYQTVVRGADGKIFGHEALLRNNEASLPHPGAILQAAERLRRSHDVGRVVRARVAADIRSSQRTEELFFVNVLAEDLTDPALYLPGAPLSRFAQNVVLELTDRESLQNVRDVAGRVARLRALGYRIALDDLGAGHAGLDSFTQLEPEFVKLDPCVIRGVHRDSDKLVAARSLVQACLDMGKAI